jgi:hypothetical protein
MKRKMLFENTHRIDTERSRFWAAGNELNAINEFFKANKLGKLDPKLIIKFIDNSQKVIGEIIKSRIPDVNEYTQLRNDKDAILNQMELPHAGRMETGYIKLSINDLSLFDFGDTVTLNEDRLEKHFDSFRYFSDNPEVIEAYDELTDIAAELTRLNNKLKFIPQGQNNLEGQHYDLGEVIANTPTGFKLQLDGFKKAIRLLETAKV